MILEMAVLNVTPGREADSEVAICKACPLIEATPGFGSINLRRSIETPNRYLLLVSWHEVEAHTIGFRQSARYQKWRDLLHHFYDPFPTV